MTVCATSKLKNLKKKRLNLVRMSPTRFFYHKNSLRTMYLKIDILKTKDFHVCRNFWCQIFAYIGGNECRKMDFTLQFKFLCRMILQNNPKPPKEYPVKIWSHLDKILRSFEKKQGGGTVGTPPLNADSRCVPTRFLF